MTPCNAKPSLWNLLRLPLPALAGLLLMLAGCGAQPGIYHTVEPGQTLYRISRAYQVDERHLARINGIDDPAALRVGQRLYIPDAEHLVPVPKISSPPAAVAGPGPKRAPPEPDARVPASPKPLPSSKVPAKPRAEVKTAPPPRGPTAPSAPLPGDKGSFQWPLRGTLLRSYGAKGGTLNKGIEIASPIGSAVHSAGAGRVIYSSDGVAGYGNLIIIRHDDGFFTVYGFNKKNLVTVGSFVGKGQRIALSGAPPSGGSPRLHFEIRNGKEAVDPIFYLP